MNVRRVTLAGRSWHLRYASSRPADEVQEILAFVAGLADIGAGGVIYVKDAGARTDGFPSGRASWGDAVPAWAQRLSRYPYYACLNVVADDWEGLGRPHVCWHSTQMCALARYEIEVVDADGQVGVGLRSSNERAYEAVARLWESGVTMLGRWPIYVAHSWQESLVHLAAHEFAHLLQYTRPGAKDSEVFCETFATSS